MYSGAYENGPKVTLCVRTHLLCDLALGVSDGIVFIVFFAFVMFETEKILISNTNWLTQMLCDLTEQLSICLETILILCACLQCYIHKYEVCIILYNAVSVC